LKSKIVSNGINALDLARRECLILKKLNHKNIVRLIEVIDDPQNNKMFFVMEYVEYGPVWKQEEGNPFTEEVARKYILDILEGLSYRLSAFHFNISSQKKHCPQRYQAR
jgi:serine/threonine protein kinase